MEFILNRRSMGKKNNSAPKPNSDPLRGELSSMVEWYQYMNKSPEPCPEDDQCFDLMAPIVGTNYQWVAMDIDSPTSLAEDRIPWTINRIKTTFPEIGLYEVRTTPSGGWHLIFVVDRSTDFLNNANTAKSGKLTDMAKELFGDTIKGIDIRGTHQKIDDKHPFGYGGIVFAPKTKWSNRDKPYAVHTTKLCEEMGKATELKIFIRNLIKGWMPTKAERIAGATARKAWSGESPVEIRQAALDILTGKYQIGHGTDDISGLPEMLYWVFLFSELNDAGHPPESLFDQLGATQPEFSQEETEKQLTYKTLDKHFTDKKYSELFPEYPSPKLERAKRKAEKAKARLEKKAEKAAEEDLEKVWTSELQEIFQADKSIVWAHRKGDKMTTGVWREQHDNGAFEVISAAVMEKKVTKILLDHGKMVNNSSLEFAMKIARAECDIDPDQFDPNFAYLIADKLVFDARDQQFHPLDQTLKFTSCQDRHLVPVDRYSKALIENVVLGIVTSQKSAIKTTPIPIIETINQAQTLKQWLINMVHLDYEDRMMLLLVGLPNASKTLITNIIHGMFRGMSGTFQFTKLGENGGWATIYDKRVGVQNDSNGGFANGDCCEKVKESQSNFKAITLRLLYGNPFEAIVAIFLALASNNLPMIPENYADNSLWKRFCILFCPNQFPKCLALEEMLQDPEFLDQMFSYLMAHPAVQTRQLSENDWNERSESLYKWSSRPIEWVINQNYERTLECDADGEEIHVRMVDVIETLQIEYSLREMELPKQIRDKIIKEVERMGGAYHRSQKTGDYIVGIRKIVPVTEPAVKPSVRHKGGWF